MVDKLLFNLKHWQVFLLGFSLFALNTIFFRGELGLKGVIGDTLPGSVFMVWMMMLGTRLRRKLPLAYDDRYGFFIATGIFLLIVGPIFSFYKDELGSFFETRFPLLLLMVGVFLVLGLYFMGYVARAMYALLKQDQDPDVARYGGDVFLWCAWWIGVWFLQPRLNLLYDQYYSASRE